jgi:ABC-type Fe3+-siderophore transport system permease subunit
MNRIATGILVGGALGILDGLTAWFTPEARPQLLGIVIGSTVKGLVAGAIIGLFARNVQSLPWTLVFGTFVGALLAFFVARMGGKYYLEIILPGSLVGLLTGYATIRYGRRPAIVTPRGSAPM